jgi:hypothetical protein
MVRVASVRPSIHPSIHRSVNVKSPSSRIKRLRTLVQILSHGVARGVCHVLPTVKKPPDDIIEKSANHTADLQWVFAGIGNQETSHASGDSQMTPEWMTSSSWRPYCLQVSRNPFLNQFKYID